ncbi:hypothetical protein N9A45_00690 [bacterium]|nr:hypothetical protein [bacterium]
MPRCRTTIRDMRALRRSLQKATQQLRRTEQNATAFKKMAFAAEKEYKRRHQADADILRNSLRNISVPFYNQKKENRRLKKIVKLVRKQNAALVRQLSDARKIATTPKLISNPSARLAPRKKTIHKTSGNWVLLRSMDI